MYQGYKDVINYMSAKDVHQNTDEIRMNRLLVNLLVITSLFALFYVLTSVIVGYKPGIYFMIISTIIHLVNLYLFKKQLSYTFCANLYVFNCTFIAILPCSYFSGGLWSPVIPWFALINIIALLLLRSSKNTFIWVGINAFLILLMGAGVINNYEFPIAYNPEMKSLFFLMCLIGLPFIIFFVASVFEKTSQNALKLLTVYNDKIVLEKKRSEELLLNILPDAIANRLMHGEQPIADYFDEASIVFVDIVNFTSISVNNDPKKVVELLNDIFTHIDKICIKYNLEKIKTIGDSYMAVCGIPAKIEDHAVRAAQFSLDILNEMNHYRTESNDKIEFRIGLNCGPVIAGVIGERKFIYDLWGDAVNTASRMESNGLTNNIHCTDHFKNVLEKQNFNISRFIDRGVTHIKGKGEMQTWLLN